MFIGETSGVRHRTTLGMTQKEDARRLGVDQGTLAKWERGKREPQGCGKNGVTTVEITPLESTLRTSKTYRQESPRSLDGLLPFRQLIRLSAQLSVARFPSS
jgi:transcriptional regulator with XRE-family HTH domain